VLELSPNFPGRVLASTAFLLRRLMIHHIRNMINKDATRHPKNTPIMTTIDPGPTLVNAASEAESLEIVGPGTVDDETREPTVEFAVGRDTNSA